MTPTPPKEVGRRVDHTERTCGVAPTIEQVNPRRWRVTATNDRVTASVDYHRPAHSKRWQATNPQLVVDGQPRPPVNSDAELATLFGHTPPAVTPDPTPTDLGIHDAPGEVLLSCQKLGANHAALVTVGGTANRRLWIVTLATERGWMQFRHRYSPSGRFNRNAVETVIVVDGADVTSEYVHRLPALLALLTGREDNPTAPSINAPAAAANSNAVQIRKQSVMRV